MLRSIWDVIRAIERVGELRGCARVCLSCVSIFSTNLQVHSLYLHFWSWSWRLAALRICSATHIEAVLVSWVLSRNLHWSRGLYAVRSLQMCGSGGWLDNWRMRLREAE